MSSCRGDSSKKARPRKVAGAGGFRETSYLLYGLSSDLGHDGTFSPEVFITQAQEIIDDQGCKQCPEKTTQIRRVGKQTVGF